MAPLVRRARCGVDRPPSSVPPASGALDERLRCHDTLAQIAAVPGASVGTALAYAAAVTPTPREVLTGQGRLGLFTRPPVASYAGVKVFVMPPVRMQ